MALFDIVITGSGTWAAAWLATVRGLVPRPNKSSEKLIARVLLQDTDTKFGVFGPVTGPEASDLVKCHANKRDVGVHAPA